MARLRSRQHTGKGIDKTTYKAIKKSWRIRPPFDCKAHRIEAKKERAKEVANDK